MKSLAGPVLKSLVFVVVTVLATVELALTITNGTGGTQHGYSAVFTDATSVNTGDDVRMAGVRVGTVTSVSVQDRTKARVGFSLDSDVRLARTVSATIRYRNLIGQRYVSLDEGSGSLTDALPAGATITRTTPALDLTVLFNGFQPLFQALSPKEVNTLSAAVISVFQGEGPTIEDLLSQTAQLTDTLADKDRVIGEVVDNLNSILQVIDSHGSQLTNLISSLNQLVHGFTADRTSLGESITGIGALASDVAGLFGKSRAGLKASIDGLRQVSQNLAGSDGALNSFLQTVPGKLTTIGRLASYGSWLNFYVCQISVPQDAVPGEYGDVPYKRYPAPAGVAPYPLVSIGSPDSSGLVGVAPTASRCHS